MKDTPLDALHAMLDGAYSSLIGAEEFADANDLPFDFSDAQSAIQEVKACMDAWVEEPRKTVERDA